MSIVVGTATQPLMLVPRRRWPRQTCVDPLGPRFITDNQYFGRQPPSCSTVPCSPSWEHRESSDQKPGSIHPKVFLVRKRSKASIAPAASRKHPPAGECWTIRVSASVIPRYLNRDGVVFTLPSWRRQQIGSIPRFAHYERSRPPLSFCTVALSEGSLLKS